MNVYLHPRARGEDDGQGGVRRVVEGMQAHLEAEGVSIVDNPADADIIACHIQIPPEFLKRHPDKVFVAHNHGLYWSEYEWPLWARTANVEVMEAIRVADVVTAPSEWVANTIRRHTSRDVRVVPHGIDFKEWAGGKPMGYVLWDKTRVDPVCDPSPLNAVARMLPDVQFISTFGDALPNTRIVGHQTFANAADLVRYASVYLATVRETGAPAFGTLQALACGVPVVGFDWGGNSEVLTHGVDSWLVKPGDMQGLADGIRWAIANHKTISANARETAAQYPWQRAARLYAEIYREALAKHRASQKLPRTSVIVTAYKLDKYLDECLASVAAQTDPDWECIVVDDASPDRCGEIAQSWAARDPRFRYLRNDTNLYLAGARNRGIQASRGRYILPLDADDRLAPTTLAELGDALDTDRTIHIAYGHVQFTDEQGALEDYGGAPGRSNWPYPFKWEMQIEGKNLLPYCSMYRREAWELTGGYRRRCRTAEDADLWTRLSSYGFRPRKVTERETLIYRNRPGSMSRIEGATPWERWHPGARDPQKSPAGSVGAIPLPVSSYDPPAISVIIPVGPGHGDLLLDAIDSVAAQSFPWWECLVINDSGAELPSLPTWVKVITTGSQTRVGVARARNLGLAAARGVWFLPLDADDLLEPRALEMFFAAGKANPNDVIYSDWWDDNEGPGKWKVFQAPDYDARLLTKNGCVHAVTALTPVAAARRVGGYPEGMAWEDWGLQMAFAEVGICSLRLPLPLWSYRKHTGRRRNENTANMEVSRESFAKRFGKYFGFGGKTLMACSSCSKKRAAAPAPTWVQGSEASTAPEGSVLVEFVSEKSAPIRFRGPSGTMYRFSGGEQKYVLAPDAQEFLKRMDFRKVDKLDMAASADIPAAPVFESFNPAAGPVSNGPAVAAEPVLPIDFINEHGAPPSDAPQGVATADSGLHPNVQKLLTAAGYDTTEKIRMASDAELLGVRGIGQLSLLQIRQTYPHMQAAAVEAVVAP